MGYVHAFSLIYVNRNVISKINDYLCNKNKIYVALSISLKISMMNYKTIYFLLIITILTSCAGKQKYDDMMRRADSIMDVDDDSAKVAIQMLDGAKSLLPDFTKGQRMRYELLYHKAMNKAYIPFTSDSVMLKVADYYEHHGSANDRMLVYYVLGCVYRDMHEAPMALEYYNKAVEQADTTAKDCDYATLFRTYSQMGILFDKQYLPYQELKAFDKAEKYAYLAKDTLNAIVNLQYKGGAYNILNKVDTVILINLKAAKKFKSIGNNNEAAIALGSNCMFFLQKKNAVKAQEAFKAYFSTGFNGNIEYDDSKAYILYEKGFYYLFMNQLDSAYSCLTRSLSLSKSYSNKAAITKALAQYWSKKNQDKSVAAFALKSLEYQDSDFIETRNSQLQQMQAMYDYVRQQDLAISAEKKATLRTHIIYIFVISSIVIFMVFAYIYRRNMLLKKKRIEVTKLLYEDSLLKLKNMQEELVQLKKEKDSSLSKAIQEKEEAYSKLKEEIKDICKKFDNSQLTEVDVLLRNSSIYKKFQYVEMHPKEKIGSEDWGELEKTIEQLIPSFIPILKDRLSEKEYHICLLIKLGFSISFISTLVAITPSGVSASRKKMLEKLCNRVGTPKDFDEYILKIR